MIGSGAKAELRHLEDKELAERLAAGDNDALAVVMERHEAAVLHTVRRILRNSADAADTTQDVFLEAFQKILQYNPDRGPLLGWLKQIAISRALDHRKHLKAHGTDHQEEFNEMLLSEAHSRSSETAYLVREALGKLSPEQRSAATLHYFGGFTAQEIADMTGQTLSAIRHRLFEATRKLRFLLK